MKITPGQKQALNTHDSATRAATLATLAADNAGRFPEPGLNLNMHFHSFFSYNAEGYSPSRIAWEARAAGLYAAGLCDFDVLDGLEEFISAGFLLGLRTAVSMETRVFLREFAPVDITSPGEPGVTYIMGAGFARVPSARSEAGHGLAQYRESARRRNLALVARVNSRLPDLAVHYDRDVASLTPGGAATERHIVEAYVNKSLALPGGLPAAADFWARVLGRSPTDLSALMANRPALEEQVRAKLLKRGGLGYEPPSPETFPLADDFINWVLSCGAIPMITWLDGTSEGEKDCRALLECMRAKGAAALNIIPDRNWNVPNPEDRARKQANLNEIVALCDELGLPVNIGTEMNKSGLPFADDLGGEALCRHRASFTRGAQIMVGHTLLARLAAFPYTGPAARAEFPDLFKRNAFFAAIGAQPPMTLERARQLDDLGPEKALQWFRDQGR